jgi:general secretion pathway protein G
MAATAILLLLSSITLPFMQMQWTRSREIELRRDLRELRTAIDHYKSFADHGLIPVKTDTFGYPPDLNTLVEGAPVPNGGGFNYKFLRRIPIDPMTGTTDWGLRSMQDDPDSRSWGGQNVFDVYSKSEKTAIDGSRYSEW